VILALLLVAGFAAGVQNALAGGGSFLTFPALLLGGLDPRAANITNTIALFPGQMTTGWAGRSLVTGTGRLGIKSLLVIDLIGGAMGAVLLLETPESVFSALVPWLVLFATIVFAWGSFRRKPIGGTTLHPAPAAALQLAIAIYGGYFGGGIGFLMVAALTLAGLPTRQATGTKNVLVGVINASAVAIFVFSPSVSWWDAAVLGIGAMGGGLVGAWMLKRVNEKKLRVAIVFLGLALTVGLFLRGQA